MAIKPPDPAKAWRYSATTIEGKHRQPRKSKIDRLTRLPPELRNDIYELVLVDTTRPQQIHSKKVRDPALLRTCRQIRLEAQAIYYCHNTFSLTVSVDNLEYLRLWLQYVKEICGRRIVGDLCITRCLFDDMGKLLPLIHIAYEGMKVTNLLVDSYTDPAALGIMRAVMGLGVRARNERWDMRTVEMTFDEFWLALLNEKNPIARALELLYGKMETWRPFADYSIYTGALQSKKDLQEDAPEPSDCGNDDSSEDEIGGRRHPRGWTVVN